MKHGATSLLAAVALALTACIGAGGRDAADDFGPDAEARVLALIGLDDGPAEYLFGTVVGVALDPEGRVYVADGQSSDIRVYREDGTFLARIGREGEGPGEFRGLRGMAFAPDGGLHVRDNQRMTVFHQSQDTGLWDEVEAIWNHGAPVSARDGRRMVDSLGRFHDPLGSFYTDGRPPKFRYLIHGNARVDVPMMFTGVPDSSQIHVPDYPNMHGLQEAWYAVGTGGGRAVPGLGRAPFEAAAAWDLTPAGTVVGGDGEGYVLYETTAAGDTVRIIRGERPRRAVPQAERADSLAALQARLNEVPVPMPQLLGASELAARGQVPDSLPAFIGVRALPDGDIWVELWPRTPGTRLFDVLDPAGPLRFTMQVPADLAATPAVVTRGNRAAGVVQDPDTGVQRVVVLELPERG